MVIKVLDQTIFNEDGYLNNSIDWSKEIAITIASKENIKLTEEHWEILFLLREFHNIYETSPTNRALIRFVKKELGDEKGSSLYLNFLFNGSPAKIGSKIAGLPKPSNCF